MKASKNHGKLVQDYMHEVETRKRIRKMIFTKIFSRKTFRLTESKQNHKRVERKIKLQSTFNQKSKTMTENWNDCSTNYLVMYNTQFSLDSQDFVFLRDAKYANMHTYEHRYTFMPIDPYSMDEMVKRPMTKLESALMFALVQTGLIFELRRLNEALYERRAYNFNS